jgi:hypothetical protein
MQRTNSKHHRHRGWHPPQPPHTVKMKNILISITHVYSKFRKKKKQKEKKEPNLVFKGL